MYLLLCNSYSITIGKHQLLKTLLIVYFLKFIAQVFHKIEQILVEKCRNTSRPPCHEIQQVLLNEPLESNSYKPYGEEGSKADLFSSISLINRFIIIFYLENMCYSLAKRSLSGKTVPKILRMVKGRRQRVMLKSEGTVFF